MDPWLTIHLVITGNPIHVSRESASLPEQPANPVSQVSKAPVANPPVLPPQPTNSIFSMLIEAAAMVSVILIVVFSVSLRYRQKREGVIKKSEFH